jgi:hypothetical protein
LDANKNKEKHVSNLKKNKTAKSPVKKRIKSARVSKRSKALKVAQGSPGVWEIMRMYWVAARYSEAGGYAYAIENRASEIIDNQSYYQNIL